MEGKADEAGRVAEVGIQADVLASKVPGEGEEAQAIQQTAAAAGGWEGGTAALSPAPWASPAWNQSVGLAAFGAPSCGVPAFGAPALEKKYAPFSTGAMPVSTLQPWMAPASAINAPKFLTVPAAAANPWAAAAAKASATSDAWGSTFERPAAGGSIASSVLRGFRAAAAAAAAALQVPSAAASVPASILTGLLSPSAKQKGFTRGLSAGNENDGGGPSSSVLQPVFPSAVDLGFGGQLLPGTAGRECEGHTAAAVDGPGRAVIGAVAAAPAAAPDVDTEPLYYPASISSATAALRPVALPAAMVTDRLAPGQRAIPLRQLDLSTAGLEDADIRNHLQLYRSTLQALDLSGNTSLTAAGLAALAPFTSLTKLVLRDLRVSGSCLQALASLTQLRSLDLTSSQMAQCMG